MLGFETPANFTVTVSQGHRTIVEGVYHQTQAGWIEVYLIDHGVHPLDDSDFDGVVHFLEYFFNLRDDVADHRVRLIYTPNP